MKKGNKIKDFLYRLGFIIVLFFGTVFFNKIHPCKGIHIITLCICWLIIIIHSLGAILTLAIVDRKLKSLFKGKNLSEIGNWFFGLTTLILLYGENIYTAIGWIIYWFLTVLAIKKVKRLENPSTPI